MDDKVLRDVALTLLIIKKKKRKKAAPQGSFFSKTVFSFIEL